MGYLVVMSKDLRQLPETGEAWLLDGDGTPRAKFYDGNLVASNVKGNEYDEDDTIKLAG